MVFITPHWLGRALASGRATLVIRAPLTATRHATSLQTPLCASLIVVVARSRYRPAGGGGTPGPRAACAAPWAAGRPADPPPRSGRPALRVFVATWCAASRLKESHRAINGDNGRPFEDGRETRMRGDRAGESSRCEDPAPTVGMGGDSVATYASDHHLRPHGPQREGRMGG